MTSTATTYRVGLPTDDDSERTGFSETLGDFDMLLREIV